MKILRRQSVVKGILSLGLLGLLSAALIIAACGGTSEARTTPTDPTSPATSNGQTGNTLPAGKGTLPGGSGTLPGGSDTLPVGSGTLPGSLPASEFGSAVRSTSVQYSTNQQVGIWVNGLGLVTISPDIAVLNVGVEARGKTVQDARNQAAEAMDRIMQALKARNIESKDITTQFFNISPEYVWNDRTRLQDLVGYRVNNQVTVKIREMESTGPIIDELVEAGGDLARIQGISFIREDSKPFESQARKLAVEDLMAKAQQYADLTGVTLGAPIFLSETGGFTAKTAPAAMDMAFAEAGARVATPISGGELNVTISVQGVFSME